MTGHAGNPPEAWVKLPAEDEVRPYLGQDHPYDFGFVAGMARLVMAHPGIAPFFGALFRRIMFEPGGALSRREREMVAAVSAAAQDCFY